MSISAHDDIPERLASLREVQSPKGMISASGEELSALSPSGRHAVPSVLACTEFFSDTAFKEEL